VRKYRKYLGQGGRAGGGLCHRAGYKNKEHLLGGKKGMIRMGEKIKTLQQRKKVHLLTGEKETSKKKGGIQDWETGDYKPTSGQ